MVEIEENRPSENGATAARVPDPEVTPKAKRRRFSAEYKLRILREAEACSQPGELGALMRREGLYSSLLSDWRRQREAGSLEGLRSKKRGRKARPEKKRIAKLEQENARLRHRLEQAEAIIEVQKKLARMLEDLPPDGESA